MSTKVSTKSDAVTKHENIVTIRRKQKQDRSPLVPWWRVKTTQKPKRVSRPTVSAFTTPKVVWDARAYYFPGALPKISEAIIFVNPLSAKKFFDLEFCENCNKCSFQGPEKSR